MTESDGAPSLSARLEQYLSRAWGRSVRVRGLSRIPAGASRETYRFDAETEDLVRGLILRRDPIGNLIETDRRVEFLAYKSFHGIVPVPEPLILDTNGGPLERPFFIMSRIDGTAASLLTANPYGEHAHATGKELFRILGRIAHQEVGGMPLAECFELPTPESSWRVALDRWEHVLLRDERHPQPIVRAAIRRLRKNPPTPAAKISVVHGDYRSGNFLHDGAGHIVGILDWEMVHFGDPLEDLAWCCDPLWNHLDDTRVAGSISEVCAFQPIMITDSRPS